MRHKGFTLIETIYSTLLLSFIVITICNLYPSSFVAIKRGEGTLQADALAQNILEEVRSRPFPNLTTGPVTGFGPVVYGNTEYTPTVNLSTVPQASDKFVLACNVSVTWKLQNQIKSVHHANYICNVRR